MAATTLKAIIDRFQAVCEGTPALSKAQVPFSFEREPAPSIDDAYYIEDAGIGERRPQTNDMEARVDQLVVWVARRLRFDGQTQAETLETTANTIERLIIADGRSNNYHARLSGREGPAQLNDTDVLVMGLTFEVDYDYSTATA